MKKIRSNHSYSYRSGEWAEIVTEGTFQMEGKERPVYVVQFPDGELDLWAKEDDMAGYEIRNK